MTYLLQIMLEELRRRNFAETTIRSYLHGVEHFSRLSLPKTPSDTSIWSSETLKQCYMSAAQSFGEAQGALLRTSVFHVTFYGSNRTRETMC